MKLHKSVQFFIVCCLFTVQTFAQTNPRKAYIAKYKEVAIVEMKRTGIPASITLAQGILESGSGKSTLAIKANNHFGIKCHDWTGPSISVDDDEVGECFRKYKDPYHSYKDHSEFLTTRSRYASLFDLGPTDYKGWAKGLKKAGYATNPQYAHMLIDIIEEEKLYLLDAGGPVQEYIDPRDLKYKKRVGALDSRIEIANGRLFIRTKKGDTFYNFEKETGRRKVKLLKYNELPKDYVLGVNQIIYFQRKKGKAARGYEFHLVKAGENLYDIAQKYGVKIEKIRKFNDFTFGHDVSEGDRVYLRNKKWNCFGIFEK